MSKIRGCKEGVPHNPSMSMPTEQKSNESTKHKGKIKFLLHAFGIKRSVKILLPKVIKYLQQFLSIERIYMEVKFSAVYWNIQKVTSGC
ncbi:hypothetical protein TNIN_416261 [Trichonephila inaurata madagascariensis]|uniref:Uncharacterized protein n=1 Tax=Trichonephila inaurata madagascariensis TaxID=2747483 RepID=A0A8X6XEE5_9ARAC|nr:hypothetical protein TNIN_416261 [Trichonephila inaurata madagascariensis]